MGEEDRQSAPSVASSTRLQPVNLGMERIVYDPPPTGGGPPDSAYGRRGGVPRVYHHVEGNLVLDENDRFRQPIRRNDTQGRHPGFQSHLPFVMERNQQPPPDRMTDIDDQSTHRQVFVEPRRGTEDNQENNRPNNHDNQQDRWSPT